ncbi:MULTISPECIES: hypothetical protein [unclassified Dehalobacter]|uniref:hypothetical protein n=1 Tax=unclassified Dehalobacter TaxID=2635733 RepID=UPI0010468FBD|nr:MULTISPECIES: hypothetical protein [unclassified Dehalobacter]TCX51916.1 hypothetical protein C1I36_06245 [Dehalobacter sp. 14DCB1]TCX52976.1 hypothetical protein C1I38_07925 [Dehalobacter sp. 12DCB1]
MESTTPAVSKDACNERHKALENYLSNDKTAIARHDGDIKDVQEAIVRLTTLMEKYGEKSGDHEDRIRTIESKPAKRWESVVGQIIQLLVAAGIGGVIGKLV